MTVDYNLKNIRMLLTEGFSVEDLWEFCFDEPEFRTLCDQLPQNASKAEITRLLVIYAKQKSLFEPLLTWASKINPTRYEAHQPYFIIIDFSSANYTQQSGPPKQQSQDLDPDEWSIKNKKKGKWDSFLSYLFGDPT